MGDKLSFILESWDGSVFLEISSADEESSTLFGSNIFFTWSLKILILSEATILSFFNCSSKALAAFSFVGEIVFLGATPSGLFS